MIPACILCMETHIIILLSVAIVLYNVVSGDHKVIQYSGLYIRDHGVLHFLANILTRNQPHNTLLV